LRSAWQRAKQRCRIGGRGWKEQAWPYDLRAIGMTQRYGRGIGPSWENAGLQEETQGGVWKSWDVVTRAQARLFRTRFQGAFSEALTSKTPCFSIRPRPPSKKIAGGARKRFGQEADAINQLVKPVQKRCQKFDVKISEGEKARIEPYRAVGTAACAAYDTNQIDGARHGKPGVRGRWGEVKLRRVVGRCAGCSSIAILSSR